MPYHPAQVDLMVLAALLPGVAAIVIVAIYLSLDD